MRAAFSLDSGIPKMPSPVFAYPLYPTVCILSAVLLLCVFTTSFMRQNWNLGVSFLCFWLFWGNLTYGINGVLWSDNDDVKAFVYCDIGKPDRGLWV